MDDKEISELRKKIFLTAYRAGSAHLASAFSIIELLYVLYCKGIIDIYSIKNNLDNRDRIILSKGHASLALYTILWKIGIITEDELYSFCMPGSHLGGEPKLGAFRGIEASTGSLGHGLSFAVGQAIAYKIKSYDKKVYVIIGDGECQEGTIWEAAMSIIRYRLDNLIIIIDDNKLQAMDTVESIMGVNDWKCKWESFGFEVLEVDGHNIDNIEKTLSIDVKDNIPRVIISHTIKGKGVSFMENVPIWHYRMPNEKELEIVMKELNISKEELFG